MSAALEASVSPALEVSVASAVAALVSVYTADAHFLDAASAAVAVAAEAAAVGAVELAGYGHPPGAGSTPAGPNLHLRVKKLASRRSKSNKQRLLRKRSDESHPNPPRPRTSRAGAITPAGSQYSPRSAAPRRVKSYRTPHVWWPLNSSGSFAIFAAMRLASSLVSSLAADRRPGSSSK